MPRLFWRIAAPIFLIAAGFFVAHASYAQPATGGAAAGPTCVTRSGHGLELRRFVTSRVTLYSPENGARLASVNRNDLSDVRSVAVCDNTTSFVLLRTQRFGERLAMRSSLVLGGGFGPACRCVQSAGTEFDSTSRRSA